MLKYEHREVMKKKKNKKNVDRKGTTWYNKIVKKKNIENCIRCAGESSRMVVQTPVANVTQQRMILKKEPVGIQR